MDNMENEKTTIEEPSAAASAAGIPSAPVTTAYSGNGVTINEKKGAGWITFLRVILWIIFGSIIVAGLAGFVVMSDNGDALVGIGILAGSVLTAFLTVAGGMVALDAAENIRKSAVNSARILSILQNRHS